MLLLNINHLHHFDLTKLNKDVPLQVLTSI